MSIARSSPPSWVSLLPVTLTPLIAEHRDPKGAEFQEKRVRSLCGLSDVVMTSLAEAGPSDRL